MTPSPWNRVEDVLRQRYVTDVLVPGRIDRDEAIARFAPQPLVVFVLLDDGALRLESVGGYGRLEVRVVDSVTLTASNSSRPSRSKGTNSPSPPRANSSSATAGNAFAARPSAPSRTPARSPRRG